MDSALYRSRTVSVGVMPAFVETYQEDYGDITKTVWIYHCTDCGESVSHNDSHQWYDLARGVAHVEETWKKQHILCSGEEIDVVTGLPVNGST